jgi:hypothetical protein
MSRINHIITPQAFEFIRDRVAEILKDELDNQFLMSYDADLDVAVEVERSTQFDESELPALNVMIENGAWGQKHMGSSVGTYLINIDAVTSSPATPTQPGDSSSAMKGQKLAGKIRCILEDPQYKTLGFSVLAPGKPFIVRVFCSAMQFGTNHGPDANNQSTSRVVLTVEAVETADLLIPKLIAGYDTVVKMGNTSTGYAYTGENYG